MILLVLVRAYRAWPLRPRCNARAGAHTALCRAAAPLLAMADGPRCGDFDEG
jgi:hypothetical protein